MRKHKNAVIINESEILEPMLTTNFLLIKFVNDVVKFFILNCIVVYRESD